MKISKFFINGIVLCLIFFLTGCQEQGSGGGDDKPDPTKTTSLTLSVALDDLSQSQSSGLYSSLSSSSSVSNVKSVTVDVLSETETLISGQTLSNAGGVWSALLENLPVGIPLTFQVKAFDNDGTKVLSGSTTKSLSSNGGDDNNVTVEVGEDYTVTLPKIKKVQYPTEIEMNQTAAVNIEVEGPADERLDYRFKAANSGGSFEPVIGNLTPTSSSKATLISTYAAPSSVGTFRHSFQLSNQDGFSTKVQFETNIVTSSEGGGIQVLFTPWLVSFTGGPRIDDRVYWRIEVGDDKPLNQLTYNWRFESSVYPSVAFSNSSAKNPYLKNYHENVEGKVILIISDADGGSTEVVYHLPKGQFPDCIVNCDGAFANAGNDITVESGQLVSLDGSSSYDSGGAVLTYHWVVKSQPEGSTIELSNPTTANPSFTPAIAGTYVITLVVTSQNGSDSDDVIITVTDPPVVVTKPTLKLSAQGGNTYLVSLLSPESLQAEKVHGVNMVGLKCVGFVSQSLTGLNSLDPDVQGWGDYISISFTDTRSGERKIAGSELDLYTFDCTQPPSFNLTAETAITYVGLASIAGPDNIDTVD